MRVKLIRLTAALTAAAMLAAGGCGLLPEEEQAPAPPVIHSYEKTEYTLAAVERGDIEEELKITFSYKPARQQMLSFPINGAELAGVYVTGGDVVTEGMLLAELDDGGLAERIESQRETIAGYERSMDALAASEALELEGYDIRLSADPENEGVIAARASAVESYAAERKTLSLRLSAAETRLDELLADAEQRRLYAPFDGTVTYVKSFGTEGYRSTAGDVFITISDKTTLTFSCDDSKSEGHLSVGDAVNISLNGELHPATITAVDGKVASLEPDEFIPGVGEGTFGIVTIVTDAVYDVLYVPAGAVKSANGQPIVYILKDGVRTLHEVETGFIAAGLVEITSGLEEGEQVIVS